MRTSVAITTIDRIPSQRDRTIACKLCGAEFPRWMKRQHEDDPRRSGMWLLLAHQMDTHSESKT